MRKEFYVFRHGETELNRQKRWQGSGMDYELNESGRQQAEELAQKLAGKGLEIIFSSPLKRALQTAETVAAACAGDSAAGCSTVVCFASSAMLTCSSGTDWFGITVSIHSKCLGSCLAAGPGKVRHK